jgi:hypothetical protein
VGKRKSLREKLDQFWRIEETKEDKGRDIQEGDKNTTYFLLKLTRGEGRRILRPLKE